MPNNAIRSIPDHQCPLLTTSVHDDDDDDDDGDDDDDDEHGDDADDHVDHDGVDEHDDTGFFKKNSHPPTCCHITPDPPVPP